MLLFLNCLAVCIAGDFAGVFSAFSGVGLGDLAALFFFSDIFWIRELSLPIKPGDFDDFLFFTDCKVAAPGDFAVLDAGVISWAIGGFAGSSFKVTFSG